MGNKVIINREQRRILKSKRLRSTQTRALNKLNRVKSNYISSYEKYDPSKVVEGIKTVSELNELIKNMPVGYGVGDLEVTKKYEEVNMENIMSLKEEDLETNIEDVNVDSVRVCSGCYMPFGTERTYKTLDGEKEVITTTNINNSDKMYYQTNINNYLEMLFNLPALSNKIWFHNLTYDGWFIILALRKRGFTIKKSDDYIINEYGDLVAKNKFKIKNFVPNTIEVIMAKGQIYQIIINVKYEEFKVGRMKSPKQVPRRIELRDSMKVANGTLQNTCLDFLNLYLSKEGFDYDKMIPEDYIFNKKELRYMYDDCYGLKELCKLLFLEGIKLPNGTKHRIDSLTIASESMNDYKDILFKMFLEGNNEPLIQEEFDIFKRVILRNINSTNKSAITKATKENVFRRLFPVLTADDDSLIRESYRGGITIVNKVLLNKFHDDLSKKKRFKIGEKYYTCFQGKSYDVNSLYPSVMYDEVLPFGEPFRYEGAYKDLDESRRMNYPCAIHFIRIKGEITLKNSKVPCLQIKGNNNFNGNEYVENNLYIDKKTKKQRRLDLDLVYTTPQLETFLDAYKIKGSVNFKGGMAFKGTKGLFKNYIDKWRGLKIEGEKTGNNSLRQLSKLMLNSLYGKFCMGIEREEYDFAVEDNTLITVKQMWWNEERIEHLYSKEVLNSLLTDGEPDPKKIREFTKVEEEKFNMETEGEFTIRNRKNVVYGNYLIDPIFTAMGSYITSYARARTITGANNNSDRWLYIDTDSLYVIGDIKDNSIPVDVNKTGEFGLWKHEKNYSDIGLIGPKRYYVVGYDVNKESTEDKLIIKCCGLSKKTIKKIKDKNLFRINKRIANGEITVEDLYCGLGDDILYYYDKERTKAVEGVFEDTRSRNYKGGKLIEKCAFVLSERITLFS